MAFVQTAHSLVPVNPRSVMSIEPKNWRKFPGPIKDPTRVYVPVVPFVGGSPNTDGDASNNGEVGNINQTGPDFVPKTQAGKASLLGTTIAPDIGVSYGTNTRGSVEPYKPYPSVSLVVPPAAFCPASWT